MSDTYTWNNRHSLERRAIENFLSTAEAHTRATAAGHPHSTESILFSIVLLRAMLNLKPSELPYHPAPEPRVPRIIPPALDPVTTTKDPQS